MPMRAPDLPPAARPLAAGSLAVLAGSAAGLWAPGPLAAVAGLVALLRVCWIDENIRQDLDGAERMPAGYAHTLRLRRNLAARLFGAAPEPITCPRLLASHLRAQAHAIYAFLFGLLAAALAAGAGDGALGLAAAAGALGLGLGRVDRLARADAHLRRGEALPRPLLDDRGPLLRLLVNPGTGGRSDARPDPAGDEAGNAHRHGQRHGQRHGPIHGRRQGPDHGQGRRRG
jgi:hypothetical protein